MIKIMQLHTEIQIDELLQDLAELPNEDLIDIIKDLDKTCACYEFTKELRDYFVNEMKKEDAAYKKMEATRDAT